MTKGSDLLVRALEHEGVDRIFGVPGEENLDVVESLRGSKIELVLTRHEQAAAFMAATHGRLTGRPGVCISTLGPGALNFATGAAYAHLGAMPMVMITGQKAIMSSRQARFQIVDVIASMKPLTKLSRQIVSAVSIPTLVRDAFRVAMEERPGPVHLELPEDIAGEEVADVPMVPIHPIEIPVAHRAALDRAAEMILRAERPLIMLGAAASRPRSTFGLAGFVRRTGIPFFTTQMGKGTVPGGTNLYMGTAALSERDYVHEAVDKADLIIAIGHDTIEKPPFIMGPKGPQVIHISYTPANVEQVYFPNAEVVGDVGPSLELLADRLEGKLPRAGALLSLRDGILSRIADRATESRWPPTPQRLVHDVRQVIPSDGIVALDNGMYKIWFARNYRTFVANTLLLDNALATMGAGLPSAMMAAMLYPDRRVMAVCGDGGFMMNSQELETAVRLKLNLVVLILDDGAYGMIRWKQAVDDFPDFGLTFGNPDFVRYAESYGARGARVEKLDDFIPTLEAAFKSGGVHLIAAPIDYSENMRVLVEELRARIPADPA
ncbi:acetolactate synthase large subunit [Bradyrhizobium sp. U87765 SZCCT0131]|uniref:acetolactate synthase large subunit n=1 Tax=unclassified Bradyrhizobium TaxID=2631580 RepID=UPI001BACCDAA|nr:MULTISPECIES: acetolactate synthase large subunit [unclassified Bradyrhizobium]MBR1217690.1 acetolactate synthase large subunit [Bradyrhizobium sp. U87765 SZCCT0131]MBR1261364.1 acetolactate synthase large subunit [Bradyrhizobium sp. U87765 SZCCT0134]MBR1303188.1 acetolactate synthase large subunit [Bradyrhizobium sp. U87765 SZCCT0110]MBR1318794.1 acetolactate synthase large subunit [Bradyrhizobium sp. U87765 SZCCT0109]MBR1347119.1 acetolactate synthase large subunit [Bradyrhizobium sp. U87